MTSTEVVVPTIQELATYGVNPGVLVAVIVVFAVLTFKFILEFAKWFLVWHEKQMKEQRDSHTQHMERIHARLDAIQTILNRFLQ